MMPTKVFVVPKHSRTNFRRVRPFHFRINDNQRVTRSPPAGVWHQDTGRHFRDDIENAFFARWRVEERFHNQAVRFQ